MPNQGKDQTGSRKMRNLGISAQGNVPWGTHLCQFYQTKKDQTDVLVPYFKAGLEQNEYCMWLTSEPLTVDEAKKALKRRVKDLDHYIKKGQIEFHDSKKWYKRIGNFNPNKTLRRWIEKEKEILKRGFDGLRLSGDTSWLEEKDWKDFNDYETMVNHAIDQHKMIAICSYPLDKCSALEVIDIVTNHQSVLIKRDGKWVSIVNRDEERLKNNLTISENKYQLILESACEGIVSYDNKGTVLEVNPAFSEITGISREEIVEKNATSLVRKFIKRRDIPKILGLVKRRLSGELIESYCIEFRGKILEISSSREGVRSLNTVIIRDITEQKRTEKELKETEERFKTLFTNAMDGIAIYDLEKDEFNHANDAFCQMSGYTLDEVKKQKIMDLHPKENLTHLRREFERQSKKRKTLVENIPMVRKDGSIYHVDIGSSSITIDGSKFLLGIFRDLSERKLAEEQLRDSKEYIENIFNNVSNAISVIDPTNYHIVRANRAFLNTWNCEEKDIIGKPCYSITHDRSAPCEPPDDPCPLQETIRTGEPDREEHIHRTCRGLEKHFEVATFPLKNERGEIERVIHTSHDVTERKKAEEELKRSQQELSARNKIAKVFLTVPDEEVYNEVLMIVLEMMKSKYGVFGYIDENGAFVVPSMTRHIWKRCNVADKTYVFPREEWGDSTWPHAIREKRIIYSNEPSSNVPKGHVSIQRHISLPIIYRGQVIGLFQVANKKTDYGDRDIQQLETIANFIAPILSARLEGDRQEAARIKAEAELRSSEERYREIFNSSSDAVLVLDLEGNIVDVNPEACSLYGYSIEEFGSIKLSNLIHDNNRSVFEECFRNIECEGELQKEVRNVRKDGSTFDTEVKLSRFYYQGKVHLLNIVRDITERKRIERLKDEFISTVSHELRTPLTSIHGVLGLINKGTVGEMPPQTLKLLRIAERNSVRLKNLIDDILDFQKIESGKMTFDLKPLKLKPIVETSLEENKSFGEQFNVKFILDDIMPDIKVNADSDRLKQVMDNLLSNAAKFSQPNSSVEVSVSRREDAIRIAVKDHGPGIPVKFQDKIFQKFTQVDSSMTREKGGTGLGLSIVKSIIDHHGGRIDFDTEIGKGTTFYFELPEWNESTN
jgi:PAS domain S-box-containing protein